MDEEGSEVECLEEEGGEVERVDTDERAGGARGEDARWYIVLYIK